VEIIDAMLAQVEICEPDINAFVMVVSEEARAAARKAERAVMLGDATVR
jgi:Asp-tRNA(Asn)/Glu-tRNA(Gln) amidotransferase A subunit family amidase